MNKKIELEAKTLEEAQRRASEELKLPIQKIKLTVIKERKGILGIGASATYEAEPDLNLPLEGKQYIERILKELGIDSRMEMRTLNNATEIYYTIETDENPLLIGREGRNLEAIQLLVKTFLGQYTNERLLISVDIGSYKENRKRQLEILATKVAKDVARSKIEVKLNPMNSFERRIIHTKLSEWRDVYTESEGEGENRRITIKPSRK